jgi:hypothetical protein
MPSWGTICTYREAPSYNTGDSQLSYAHLATRSISADCAWASWLCACVSCCVAFVLIASRFKPTDLSKDIEELRKNPLPDGSVVLAVSATVPCALTMSLIAVCALLVASSEKSTSAVRFPVVLSSASSSMSVRSVLAVRAQIVWNCNWAIWQSGLSALTLVVELL